MKWGGNPEASLWSFFTDVRSDLSSAIFLSQHNVQRETRNRSEACNAVPWHRLVVGGSISDCSEDARFAMSTGSMCRISFRVHFEFISSSDFSFGSTTHKVEACVVTRFFPELKNHNTCCLLHPTSPKLLEGTRCAS